MKQPSLTPALEAVRQKAAGLPCVVEGKRASAPRPHGGTSPPGRERSSSSMLELSASLVQRCTSAVASTSKSASAMSLHSWAEAGGLGTFLTPEALSAVLQACAFISAKEFVACILHHAKATFCCQADGTTEIYGLCVCAKPCSV